MMDSTNVVIAAMRALVNEIENIKALPEDEQEEEHHLYQGDLEDALGELVVVYNHHREANPELSEWQQLLRHFERNRWPARA